MWNEITYLFPNFNGCTVNYPFPNFNGCTVEVRELISNSITHFTRHVLTYPCYSREHDEAMTWSKRFRMTWPLVSPHKTKASNTELRCFLVLSCQGQLEQPERLRSENTPAAPVLPILLIHIRSPVKTRQNQSYKFKKIAKKSNFGILH